MKVSFLSDNLTKKISFINHAVSVRSQLPILSNFLLEAKNGKLTISATDLEIGIISSITANTEEEGLVTVPAKNFSDLFSNIVSQKISLETEGNVLKLKGKNIRATFQTIPAEDFPRLYKDIGEEILSLAKKDIEEFLARVSFAAAIDAARPALSGILLENQKDGLCLVATDSYRLSFQKTTLKASKSLEKPIIIPARVIKEMLFIKEDEGEIGFHVSSENNQIIITQGDSIVIGRLIDATYPTYTKIIPTQATTKVEIDREDLLNAIRICSVFARETANIVKFTVEKEKLIVSANSPSVGEDLVEIEAKLNGEENEIAFNAKYLIDILSILTAEVLIFEMTGPLNPGVFKIKGDNSFLHLIMPIRVQQ
ncbi:MAG: DNA polymerase III subunit beta [Candidatus Levybacteria bacterium]|nr:DNA polymerase III subunit beta [Candidatus Levybacteria bacterium]